MSESIERKDVLAAAAEVVREEGEGALSVRAVAKKLGCSTQPIYTLFRSMDELRRSLVQEARARYRNYIEEYLTRGGRSGYESYGMGFVRFAAEEKGLFRFLFLGEHASPDPYLGDIVGEMMRLYHIDEETALAFHADMTVFSFGLAALVNGNSDALTEEEISEAFKREFYALYGYYFPTRKKFWEEK